MAIFSLLIISAVLVFLELSVLPYFKILGATPFLVIPFLVLLSVKYKGFFHIFLAFVFGMIFDFATTGVYGRFTLIFLVTVIAGRVFFFRENYDIGKSFLMLTILSTLALYASELNILFKLDFVGWQSYLLITVSGLVLTLLFAAIVYIFGLRYIDWLNKKYTESFKR